MNDEKKEALVASLNKNLPATPVEQNRDIKDDYNYSRKTYKDLIDKGSYALDGMIELAAESEHPRAYEVLSGMMKNMADITDKLMDLQKKKEDIESKKDAAKPAAGTINNNMFVGSTTDLQRLLAKGEAIDVDPDE